MLYFLSVRNNRLTCVGIFKQSMGARNRVEIGLSNGPARQHGLAESVPWNRLLGSLKVEENEDEVPFDKEKNWLLNWSADLSLLMTKSSSLNGYLLALKTIKTLIFI